MQLYKHDDFSNKSQFTQAIATIKRDLRQIYKDNEIWKIIQPFYSDIYGEKNMPKRKLDSPM